MLLDRSILFAAMTALSLVALPVGAADDDPATPKAPEAAAGASATAPAADPTAKEPEAKDGDAKEADAAKDEPKAAEGEADAKEPAAAEGEAEKTDPKAAEGEAEKTEPKAAEGETDAKEPKEAEAAPAKTYVTGDVVIGDPNAPLTVIEYASFTCPHCASFHTQTWPDVKKNYIDTGKVKFIMREVYFDEYGLWAGMVARCGGEAGYYPIVDTLLNQQQAWTRSSDIVASIIQIGRRAGLSKAQIEACLTDRDYAKALIEAYQANATNDDVRSTPTFIIGSEKATGAMGYEDFSKLLDAALADG